MSQDEKYDWTCRLIYADSLDCRESVQFDDKPPDDPIGEFLAKAADEMSLAKNGGSAHLDPAWDEAIGAAPRIRLSKSFLERSDRRLAGVAAKIRKFFGPEHIEEAEEAIELAQSMRDAVRQDFIEA